MKRQFKSWSIALTAASFVPTLALSTAFANAPSSDANETSKTSKDYSTFWTGFQHLPKRADAHGTPIHISGKAVDEFRVTESGGKTLPLETKDLGEYTTKFRSREEEACADQQAAEVKAISHNPKYQDMVKAGVISAVDIEVQFSTYVNDAYRIPTDRERRDDLVSHVESRWTKPTFEVHLQEKDGVQFESGKIVLRPYFTAYTQTNSFDRPSIPVRRSTGDREFFFMCTVIPTTEILTLMDRIRLGAKQLQANSRPVPAPLRLIPEERVAAPAVQAPAAQAPAPQKPTTRRVLTIQ